jgi:hypothetical protein
MSMVRQDLNLEDLNLEDLNLEDLDPEAFDFAPARSGALP